MKDEGVLVDFFNYPYDCITTKEQVVDAQKVLIAASTFVKVILLKVNFAIFPFIFYQNSNAVEKCTE